MRYFVAYHNAQKMGYSCTKIPEPRVKTRKPVQGTEGSIVWLVAGEGKSPKSYYLASRFVIDKAQVDLYAGTDLPNQVSGPGVLLGHSIPLTRTAILSSLQRSTANFVNGFCELRDPDVIRVLRALT